MIFFLILCHFDPEASGEKSSQATPQRESNLCRIPRVISLPKPRDRNDKYYAEKTLRLCEIKFTNLCGDALQCVSTKPLSL